jgi:hypothetical protein
MKQIEIFERFKFIFMDYMNKEFTIDDIMNHGAERGIYLARTTFKNACYRFEKSGYLEKTQSGRGWKPSMWVVLPSLQDAIDFAEYQVVKQEVKIKQETKDKQAIYRNKYDQLTRSYELIEPQEGRKVVETMAHSHERFKSPKVYVGNMWGSMI